MSEYIIDWSGIGVQLTNLRESRTPFCLWPKRIRDERRREEIVRCRDCKHMHVWDVSSIFCNHDHDVVFCLRFVDGMRMTVEPDDFCAWGEKVVGE